MATLKKAATRTKAYHPSMLIMRGADNVTIELKERLCVEAFRDGWADVSHYNALADMQGAMMLAATVKPETMPIAERLRETIGAILNRIVRHYQATGKFTCSPEDLATLGRFVTEHRDFWMRQPTALYVQAYAKMKEIQDDLRKSGKLKSE